MDVQTLTRCWTFSPWPHGQLTYRLAGGHFVVEKQPGVPWLDIATEAL